MMQGLQDVPRGPTQGLLTVSAETPPNDPQWVILDALPMHVAILDGEGVIVRVNAAWKRYGEGNQLGGTDFGVGQSYLNTCDSATGEGAEEATVVAHGIRAVLNGDRPEFVLEYPCHSPKEARWFRLAVTPLGLTRAAGVVVTRVDITGPTKDATTLRHAEKVARESELRLDFALAAADVGDWSLDLRTNEFHRSLRHDQCFGYRALLPSWTYDTFLAHIMPGDRDRVSTSYQRALAGQGEYSEEFRTTWPDGSVHWLWTRGRFYFDNAGIPYRVAGIVVDITARKHAEREIAGAVERLTEAQSVGRIGDWEWDIATQTIRWSPEVFKIFGRDPLLGPPQTVSDVAELLDAPSRVVQDEAIAAAIAGASKIEYELVVVRPDGDHAHVLAHALARRSDSGDADGLYGTVQNISDRKKLEQQMMRAQRMESIGTLAGGIAHDLNNVLSPIMLSLELLGESAADDESRELIATLGRSARHGADMVRQLLQFARGVEGQRLDVDMGEIVNEIERTVRDTFLKDIHVAVMMVSAPWPVLGDRTQLHQVLLNLCVNARDAMAGVGLLQIRVENVVLDAHFAAVNPDANQGPHVHLSVVDSGSGIDPGILEQIFDPFFTTKEFGKGTGLGLSTTKAIVKSHGGFIRVYSEPGRGTTFNVYLPSHADALASSAEPVIDLPRGSGEIILLIEDEPSVCLITKRTLEAFGYRVIVATNGAEGVATYALLAERIAVVLTDMMMPFMNGPDAIRRLHAMNPTVRVIATSGMDASAQLTGLGVRYFLAKPYATDQLLAAVQQALAEP